MGGLQDLWDEVEHAVAESLSNSEGRASAWYLEHYFQKAGLAVHRLPDAPDWVAGFEAAKEQAAKLMEQWMKDNAIDAGIAATIRAMGSAQTEG